MERCSTSVIVTEIQIKTTMRYYLTPVRWLSYVSKQGLVRKWRKGYPHVLLVGIQFDAAPMESKMELPQKIQVELLYDPAIPFLGIYLKKHKILI